LNCAKCGHGNPAGTKFCGECGGRLATACVTCGAPNPPGNKFCGECGASLAAAAAPSITPVPPRHLAERILQSRQSVEGERKQVTVLFADLKGSMELLADRDPEEARRLLDPVLERMMGAVHHFEGTVNQVMGDGIMALFGAPLAHEDHAVRACYAALRMQQDVRRYTEEVRASQGIEIQIRVGLNSGEVVVRSIGSDLRMDYSAIGQTTHLAARMEQLATPGTIRLTAGTLALAEGYIAVKSLGPIPVKGLAQPVDVYELTGAGEARTRLQVSRSRGLSRFVGRDLEMEQLRAAAEQSRAGRGQVVAVVGEPGVGKSRLYYEFLQSHHAREFLILESGSVSYGKATPFLPLVDLLRSYFMINARDDVRRIRVKVTGGLLTVDEALKDAIPVALWLLDALPEGSPFLTLEPAERRKQTFAALKRILLREIEGRPLLLVFEDLHWIDNETQAFLEGFIDSVPASRVLLAVNYRPEYRHAWASKTYYRQLRVDPLPPQSAEDLLAGLLGNDSSVASLRPLLIARTEGRPLFLEESVRMLVETGALAGERGAYRLVRAVDTLQVPATVQAILAARIDRLDPEDKRLLQAAAVIGTHVPFAVLMAVAGIDEDSLRRGLGRLQAAEFMYEARLFPELEFAFKHALTHEVAYNGVLQERRQALHRAAAEAIERIYADRLAEQIERLAHHAQKAPASAKAVRYLREAGAKSAGRSANREALAYLEQALKILDALPKDEQDSAERLRILMVRGQALIGLTGAQTREVETNYRTALALIDELGAEENRFPVLWNLWYVSLTRADYAAALVAAERLMATAEHSGDGNLKMEGHHAFWPTLASMGRPLQALAHTSQGLAMYSPDRDAAHRYMYGGHDPGVCGHMYSALASWLAGFPERALRERDEALRLARQIDHPLTTTMMLFHTGTVLYLCGDRDRAGEEFERDYALAQEYGFSRWIDLSRIPRHLRGGVGTEAIAEMRRWLDSTRVASWQLALGACVLAELLADAGHAAEGALLLRSFGARSLAHCVGPEILRLESALLLRTSAPDRAAAKTLLRKAAELARAQDSRSLELRATTDLARLLRAEGRRDEALSELTGICGSFTEGFETADLKSARALLAELGAA
jgi:class 3 adenylate cyclase